MSQAAPSSALISRSCPVCKADDAAEILQKGQLRLVRCGSCSMIYANPVASGFTSGAYYDVEAAPYYLSPEKLQSDYAPVRFERELRLFTRHCSAGRILDVGCSSGAFLFQLRKRFGERYSVVGLDASGPALDYAETQGISVVRGDFLDQEFALKFAAVTMWAVLEHVFEPDRFLARAAAVLQDRGLCFVLVPNMRSLAARLLGKRYRYIYPQHLNYFTCRTLERLTRKHFGVVERHFSHFNPIVIWQDWRQGGAEVSNEARARLLQKTTRYKQGGNPLLQPLKLGYQLAEGLLARLQMADNLCLVLRKS